MPTAPSESQSASSTVAHDSTALQHVTVERDDVCVCTMFPTNSTDADVTTEWITAGPDGYRSLEDAR